MKKAPYYSVFLEKIFFFDKIKQRNTNLLAGDFAWFDQGLMRFAPFRFASYSKPGLIASFVLALVSHLLIHLHAR